MFQFSLRDLITTTIAAGMAIAWVVEHRRLDAALVEARMASEEAASWERVCEHHEREKERMEQGIEQFGFEVMWSCGIGPSVCKRLPDGTLTSIPDSNRPSCGAAVTGEAFSYEGRMATEP